MDRNVRIAKQLVKLAKSLVADEYSRRTRRMPGSPDVEPAFYDKTDYNAYMQGKEHEVAAAIGYSNPNLGKPYFADGIGLNGWGGVKIDRLDGTNGGYAIVYNGDASQPWCCSVLDDDGTEDPTMTENFDTFEEAREYLARLVADER